MSDRIDTEPTADEGRLDRRVRPGVRYVLRPGMVASKSDGQTHYVGAMELARLYGVDLSQCEIFEPAGWWPPSFWLMAQERHCGLVKLAPRYDGNYSLPSGA